MDDQPLPTLEDQQKARILLVDDEPGIRTAVEAYLNDEGFEVTTAIDGEDGLEKAKEMIRNVK